YLATEEGRRLLDVTELDLHSAPHERMHFYDRVTDLAVDGSRLEIAGEIRNQLDRIPREGFGLALVLKPRSGSRRHVVEVGDVEHRGDVVRWRAGVDIKAAVKPIGLLDPVWDVQMRLRIGRRDNFTPLSVTSAEFEGVAVKV